MENYFDLVATAVENGKFKENELNLVLGDNVKYGKGTKTINLLDYKLLTLLGNGGSGKTTLMKKYIKCLSNYTNAITKDKVSLDIINFTTTDYKNFIIKDGIDTEGGVYIDKNSLDVKEYFDKLLSSREFRQDNIENVVKRVIFIDGLIPLAEYIYQSKGLDETLDFFSTLNELIDDAYSLGIVFVISTERARFLGQLGLEQDVEVELSKVLSKTSFVIQSILDVQEDDEVFFDGIFKKYQIIGFSKYGIFFKYKDLINHTYGSILSPFS